MATTDKYDRQLRLWGASGQRALAETCIVLLRATAAGTETLKNLVLPGIGAFCIVDDNNDAAAATTLNNTEFTSNFFLTAATGGDTAISRAQMATEYLQELNSDVKGSFHDLSSASSSSSTKDGMSSLLDFVQSTSGGSDGTNGLVSLIQNQILTKSSSSGIQNILIVASDLEPHVLLATSRTCQAQAWPLIAVHSYGLLGMVRLQVSSPMPLYNPKRSSPPDLRLATFCSASSQDAQQSLSQLQRQMQDLYRSIGANGDDNWETLTSQQHGHVPYPLILIKIQNQWMQTHGHGGKLPVSFAEKQAFQEMVKQAARDFGNELNFQEAQRNAYLAYNRDNLQVDAEQLQRLVTALQEQSPGSSTSSSSLSIGKDAVKFLVMLEALQVFLTLHQGQSPLQGTIPDMTASTELYVQLQTIYRNQAQSDLQEMRQLVDKKQQQQHMNMTSTTAGLCISDEDLSTFCQNVQFVDIFQTRTLCQEYSLVDEDNNGNDKTKPSDDDDDFDELCQDLIMACMDVAGSDDDDGGGDNCNSDERPDMLPLFWYLGFRACQLFHQRHGRYPGTIVDTDDKKYLQDIPLLHACLERVVQAYKLQDVSIVKKVLLTDVEYKVATELTRYAQAEIHTIASVVGGVASQEAVKLITGQYVPLQHTYVYSGIASTGGVYKF